LCTKCWTKAAILLSLASWPAALSRGDVLRTAGDRPLDLLHIALDLNVDIPRKTVTGSATLQLQALRDVSSIKLDAVDFQVSRVLVTRSDESPVPAEFINDGEHLTILLGDRPLPRGVRLTAVIEYTVRDPKMGLNFFCPTESEPNIPHQVWSQGESIENRYWLPCFDHPNEMQTTEMRVTAPAGHEVVSNGRLLSQKDNPDGTVTFHWLQDKPHVSYLITLIVGKFHVERETWRGKPVLYYIPEKNKSDVRRTFGNTTRMLEHFSNITGVEYPWDKYAQICAEQFGGGMENTSATTLGTSPLHDERAHLDYSADGLIAHELAHQWFGDLVTCKDWSHLWLNEGFASFMEPIWYEHDRGRDDYDYAIYQDLQGALRGGKERPVMDRFYKHPDDMFDGRSYPKGSYVLHMLRRRLGDELFWTGVKDYLTQYAHQPVEAAMFRMTLEHVSGRSLERFFYDWVERSGAPAVEIQTEWNEDDKLVEITVKQTQKEDAFEFPLDVEFHFDGGEPITMTRPVTDKEQRFLFHLPKHPDMVLIDPRDAVLMELTEKKSRDLLMKQLTDAPYAVSRIRAALSLGESHGHQEVEALAAALQKESFWGVAEQIAQALGKAGGDQARDALLEGLALPHPKARRECVEQLASFHKDEAAMKALRGMIEKGDPSYRVEAEAIKSYGKLQPDGALPFLLTLLDRDSHRDQIRSAVLEAIGKQPDAAGLETLLTYAQPGRERFTRMSAIRGLGDLAKNAKLSDDDVARVVSTMTDLFDDSSRWLRGSAVRSLEQMEETARSALPALRALASHDAERRVREAAEKAIEKITKTSPPAAQVDDLRDELKKLREQNDTLKRRLEELDARVSHDAPPGTTD